MGSSSGSQAVQDRCQSYAPMDPQHPSTIFLPSQTSPTFFLPKLPAQPLNQTPPAPTPLHLFCDF